MFSYETETFTFKNLWKTMLKFLIVIALNHTKYYIVFINISSANKDTLASSLPICITLVHYLNWFWAFTFCRCLNDWALSLVSLISLRHLSWKSFEFWPGSVLNIMKWSCGFCHLVCLYCGLFLVYACWNMPVSLMKPTSW